MSGSAICWGTGAGPLQFLLGTVRYTTFYTDIRYLKSKKLLRVDIEIITDYINR